LNSCIASLIAILLFHLVLELAPLVKSGTRAGELALLGEQLARFPGLEKLAEGLKALSARLQDPAVSTEEKRSAIDNLQQQINQQLAGSEQASGSRNQTLRQTSQELSGLEEGLGSGQGRGEGGGGQQAQSPRRDGSGKGEADGEAGGKQSGAQSPMPSSSGAPEKNLPGSTAPTGQQQQKQTGERPGDGDKEGGQDKGGGSGPDPKDNMKAKGGKGPSDGKSSEAPAQRFLHPGDQGEPALKDSRFVTVQLPEEEFDSTTAGAAGEGKRKQAGSRPPVGNLPLARPDRPDAAQEKQMLPLEYRGMIR
jgi:hypothetical protein